jgi:RNA polymerase sigma-70 factor (ECF subfamily)
MMRFVPVSDRPPTRLPARAAEDAALAARIACGDRAALEQAYRREAATVYRYALAMCANPGWAADATQDAFIVLAAQAQGFDATRGTLGAWLAGIVRHALLAQWRRESGHVPLVDADEDGAESPAAGHSLDDTPETLLVRAQSGERVWAAVRRLPVPFREALVLVDLQERTYAEAACIAGIETNTLRTRLHRARARLAALLDEDSGVTQ